MDNETKIKGKSFSVQISAIIYDHDINSKSSPGGLSLAFDSETEMWAFITEIRDKHVKEQH